MAIKEAKPDVGPTHANESTPLMVGGVLYTSTSLSEVAAIDAATGETRWVFDPKIYENGLGLPPNLGWTHRGVAYWRSGDDERIVMLTAFAQMIADPKKFRETVRAASSAVERLTGAVDRTMRAIEPYLVHFALGAR